MKKATKKKNYYFKYLHLFILGALCLVLVDLLQLEIPQIVQEIFDGLDSNTESSVVFNRSDLFTILLKMFVLILIIVFGRFWWRFFIMGASRNVETDIRNEMFIKCEELSQNYYSKNKVGDLMAYFINDLAAVRNLYGQVFLMLVDIILLSTITIYYMLRINVKLTIIALLPLVSITLIGLILNRHVKRRYKIQQKSFAELSDFVQESISGISVTKTCVNESIQIDKFITQAEDNYKKTIEAEKLALTTKMLSSLFTGINLALVLAFGGYLVIEKEAITPGQLVAFIMYVGMMVWPMRAIGHMIVTRALGIASYNRITELLNTNVDVYDKDNLEEDVELSGGIEIKDLSFSFTEEKHYALKNISLKINKGEFVGVIGNTGCGKSTLIELLLRFYNVEDKKIYFDGVDINRIKLKKLREGLGYVPQDNYLFSDKIINNVSFGDKSDDVNEKVEKVCIDADIHNNIVDFRFGYDTIIGERGVTLSGGQKQRLSIARALYKNANILIFDDSLSAVDSSTENKILNNINKNYKDKTKILIAHRVSSVQHADKIVVMSNGRIVDVGTHESLLNSSNEYRQIYELQKLD